MRFTDIELGAYLDEDLDAVQMAEIEKALRSDPAILKRCLLYASPSPRHKRQ